MPSCLIIVENLPVPLDRRVWQEARALKEAGWEVSVICPATKRHPKRFEIIDGVKILRHPLPREGRGPVGYLLEYLTALVWEFGLALYVLVRYGFDVVHICNPPDLLFLVAGPFKILRKSVVFDHHDICPELYVSKFRRRGAVHSALQWLERATFKCADVVISANETFRNIAIGRGGKSPENVFTVYSIPDSSRFFRIEGGGDTNSIIIGYVGVLGSQDGVDHLIRAVAHLRNRKGGPRFLCRIVGDGPEMKSLQALAAELSVEELVEFTGFLTGDELLRTMSTFHIGVIPDPFDEYNDKISMNKVFEYAWLGIPIVSYRLAETMRLLGPTGMYAKGNCPEALANTIDLLLQDDALRRSQGSAALAHAKQSFNWAQERKILLDAYAMALKARQRTTPARTIARG